VTDMAKTVLVVDDEEKITRMLTRFLESLGYQVQARNCGQEALDYAVEHKPDLVVLDVRLPDVSGFEVSNRLRQVYTHEALPILMLSAMDRGEDRDMGFESGADVYMSKPFEFGELSQTIETLIAH